jgi:hypothetical protein
MASVAAVVDDQLDPPPLMVSLLAATANLPPSLFALGHQRPEFRRHYLGKCAIGAQWRPDNPLQARQCRGTGQIDPACPDQLVPS